MAQGDVLLNDDGTVALNGAGLVRLVDVDSDCPDCCGSCTASATSCTHCDDNGGFPPLQYQVTFSGVTLCGCEVGGVDYSFEFAPNGGWDINDAFTLTQKAGSSCRWELLLTNVITTNTYFSSETCSGAPAFAFETDVRIVLTRTASAWTLEVFAEPDGTVAVGLFVQDNPATGVVADVSGATQLCGTITATFNNWYDTCSQIIDETGHATGGSATVVCL